MNFSLFEFILSLINRDRSSKFVQLCYFLNSFQTSLNYIDPNYWVTSGGRSNAAMSAIWGWSWASIISVTNQHQQTDKHISFQLACFPRTKLLSGASVWHYFCDVCITDSVERRTVLSLRCYRMSTPPLTTNSITFELLTPVKFSLVHAFRVI